MKEPRRRPWLSVFRVSVILPVLAAVATGVLIKPLADAGRIVAQVPASVGMFVLFFAAWLMRCPRCGASVLLGAFRRSRHYDWLAPVCPRCALSHETHTYWTRPFHGRDKRLDD